MVEFTYNEIENSRPLDVWRWSDFTEINSFVKEIYSEYYVDQYQPYDKAGAYGIQDWIGFIGVEKIEGSYTNVMGLPTQELYLALQDFKA